MKKLRVLLIYIIIIVAVILLLDGFSLFGSQVETKEYTAFLKDVKSGNIGKVILYDGDNYIAVWLAKSQDDNGKFPNTPNYNSKIQSYEAFTDDMLLVYPDKTADEYGFEFEYVAPKGESILLLILPYIIMIALFGIVFFFIMRSQSGGSNVMQFSKSRARAQNITNVKFADVAGADEEKEELREVVDFMRSPEKFTKMGARIPKGVLLVGPPGTGKTLLAKAAAGESNVPFYSISGSDFVEMFVGVGASRVRDLFITAKKTAPSVIFIDEIDAVGRQRGAGLGGGHDEREQTLNQLLVEMDGFEANEGIIVIAATNRPDILDPALLRPGRFDRRITVNMPDVKGREEILKVHSENKNFSDDVSLSDLAKSTPGFTGADLENMLNEAAILATRKEQTEITMANLNEAATRVMMGPEKKSRVITPEDKKITAYHEAGHAIAALKLKYCDPLREISIIPRGNAAGYTMTMPGNEYAHTPRNKLYDQIAMLLGGRASEAIALDDICTGAYSDLKSATELARKMVTEYGMSDKIGPLFLGGDTEVFVGKDFAQHNNLSDSFASHVDDEVREIIDVQYERIKTILRDNLEGLERVCKALIENEYLTGERFEKIFMGQE